MNSTPPSAPISGRLALALLELAGWAIIVLLLANIVVIAGGFMGQETQSGEGAVAMAYARYLTGEVQDVLARLLMRFDQPTTWQGLDIPAFLFTLTLLGLRSLNLYALERIEKSHARAQAHAHDEKFSDAERQAASRRVAVQTYADARMVLSAMKVELTFLSLDIVGSTKMKLGEDPILIEQAFTDYMKMVNKILQKNGAYKTTWTPDGQMAAFKSADAAVRAGQEILSALPPFNRDVSRLKTPFRLRAGSHMGIVTTDDETPMEKISDFSIDVSGHMQKKAAHAALWISEKLYERLERREGFADTGETVDDFKAWSWQRPSP